MPSLDPIELHQFVESLIRRHGNDHGSILNILNGVQGRYRYIPIEALYEVARLTNRSFADLCSIASAFDDLTIEPVGEHIILVCDGTACHAAGSVDIIRALEDELGTPCGSTSTDERYTLKSVYCVGACSLAPIAIIDGISFGRIRLSRLKDALKTIRDERG